jgi:FG-GAP repeat
MGWAEQAKLSPSDAKVLDQFGETVATHGDYAIVGASEAGIGFGSGQAYVFHRNGSDWAEDTILSATDKTDGAFVGGSVSLNGDWAVVGSREAAYVFQRNGSTWTEKAKHTADEATDFDDRFRSTETMPSSELPISISHHRSAQHMYFS